MMPIALTDAQMREVMAAARLVPTHLRSAFLEQLAAELRDREIGDGLVHRLAHDVVRRISWDSERTAVVG